MTAGDVGSANPPTDRPWLSIVTAVYNVERYLPEFIASIEAQRFDADRIEVIAVDDGSTDDSLANLEAWAELQPGRVIVLTKPNGGQASARNLGLEHVRGEWVAFADPDDVLDPGFVAAAAAFASAHPEVDVMSGRPILFEEGPGLMRDTHPRRQQFEGGSRVANLDDDPNVFTGSATVSLFRVDRLRELGLRYDLRVRPNFEDGHFAVHFLLGLRKPLVGLIADARYIYRKRATGDSSLQLSLGDPRRYTDVLEFGYLEVLDAARRRFGRIPAWLQHVVIYELSWYLSADERIQSESPIDPEIAPRFHELLERILVQLESEVVRRHTVRRLQPVWADIFAHLGKADDWHTPLAVRTKVDPAMRLQRINYRYFGRPPVEVFRSRGRIVEPTFAKVMAHRYYRRTLMSERIAWLPSDGPLSLELGGRRVRIADDWPDAGMATGMSLRSRLWVYRRQPLGFLAHRLGYRVKRLARHLIGPPVRAIARLPPWKPFEHAWVVMDRIHDADDNGQRLFEHLAAHRPDINAWFVIERGTPDWHRLRAAGVTKLVAHGSFRWWMLMLNARWVLSSHADMAIMRPPQIMRLVPEPTWRFGFLQHGVIKDDLSVWLNPRDIDLFVVSTERELGSIVDDGTTYVFTRKETRLTGLARFDRLLAKAAEVPEAGRNLVIVAPTWRSWLTLPLAPASQRRELDEGYWGSEYHRSWTALLASPEIREAVERRGWQLAFMPHPNLQGVLAKMELPRHVEPLTFSGVDVQELYARCALLVTDYSSVAFNVAYVDGPVVYFQFDRDAMFGGAHVGRQGYYDYEHEGFGPVTTELDGAVAAIVESIDRGPRPAAAYAERIERTFGPRDGRACERVVAALESLEEPYRADESVRMAALERSSVARPDAR